MEEGVDSGEIRSLIFHKQPISDWVDPEVEAYIRRRSMYTGMPQTRTTHFLIDEVRPLIVSDEWNKKSQEMLKKPPQGEHRKPEHYSGCGG